MDRLWLGRFTRSLRDISVCVIYQMEEKSNKIEHSVFWAHAELPAAGHSVEGPKTQKPNKRMDYRKIKDEDKDEDAGRADVESLLGKSAANSMASNSMVDTTMGRAKWKRKSVVTLALTILTSSQAILIVWSKRAGKYEYSITTANFSVEALKCAISLIALGRIWNNEGVNENNRLSTTLDEVLVYPIPAALYLVKNLLQYYIFAYVDAPGYQILKNFNIISTGILYRIILKKKLSEIQWAAFILLCAGCTIAQLNSNSDHVLQTPFQGWVMAIVMALLSGFAGVYTEAIIKKRPSRNINVQNFWLYVFGMIFNAVAIVVQDFDAVMNKGFFHGYSLITVLMILNHALSGIAVSMVMKYADNIVKVYSTSVAMLLTAVVSSVSFWFPSFPCLLPWLNCCFCCNISAFHREAAKIATASQFLIFSFWRFSSF
ncbi:putative CMP-sialic acid transporter [Quillaja saponaria]|uniref:CMP-sialic acid transporter n=1 Tax=Quillaja saponaria TaxID=32244 RepID=A0AAD7M3C3_QUISA|nr:putative CMP-sialic acid transporter [Quillaja saponaria]